MFKGMLKHAVVMALAGAAAACGSDDTDDGGTKEAMVALSGTVTRVVLVGPRPPLPGVEVCVVERPEIPCVTTDDEGKYAFPEVPADTEGTLIFSKPGFAETMIPGRSQKVDFVLDSMLIEESVAATFLGVLGMKSLDDAGVIAVDVFQADLTGLAGATLALEPAGAAKGPIYLSEAGAPDEALTQTSSLGVAWFGNVAPGEPVLSVQHVEKSCVGERGWKTDADNRLKLPVRAHAVTISSFVCH